MSRSGGGGISIGTIIFMVIIANWLFNDDDKEEVKIVDQAKQAVEKAGEVIMETRDAKTVQEIIEKAKEKFKEDKAEFPEKEKISKEEPEKEDPKIVSPDSENKTKKEEFEKL